MQQYVPIKDVPPLDIREEERKILEKLPPETLEEVKKNIRDYIHQVGRDFDEKKKEAVG
jgi:hypothetical protein